MIEFKNSLLYRDGISIAQIIATDAALKPGDKHYEKKMTGLYEKFMEKFVECYIADIEDNDAEMDAFENLTQHAGKDASGAAALFGSMLSNPHIEQIYKKGYYQFRSELILGTSIKENEELREVRDEGLENAGEFTHVGETASSGLGLLSIFFSRKHRFMSDRDIKWDLFKTAIAWLITLLVGIALTYIFLKIFNIKV